MTRVVGLDVSLTSTGVCVIDTKATEPIKLVRLTSSGARDADLAHREYRLALMASQITGACTGADLVVIEQPAYSRTIGSMHDRSGLWWLVVSYLIEREIRVAEVSPTARAKYATGRGNAGKDQVLAAVVRRYHDAPVEGNDEADALVLAAMGMHQLGEPLPRSVPELNSRALESVRWPA